MIPLRDNIPARTTPFVNYWLMAICGLIFLLQSADTDGRLTLQFGMIPLRISEPDKPVIIESHEKLQTRDHRSCPCIGPHPNARSGATARAPRPKSRPFPQRPPTPNADATAER